MITARTEDYLEEIFLLECTGREITVTDLAERLGITKGTVTATVQKLVEVNLLKHERYGALHLTRDGRQKGLMVYRRHEGLRAFFHELLGVDRDRSSEMACSMEHYMDTVTDERLFAMLEFFRRSRAERAPWVDEMFAAMENRVDLSSPLSVLETGQKGSVVRLSADEALRRKLQNLGFTTGACITCLDASVEDSVTVSLDGRTFVMPRDESAAVWLRPVA
ncbi:MAG: metal-dependent transcriptional regulator [Synergistaceae bacterium]|jgi:DtxR family Mn-dependent transcriptional regulator|nr:metal-dependent transcriptional regulator [Synergistaceae bacterium]